ncbi:MAG TPA: COX15/CtaA family protein [Marmoricola sp.]|nr:COX15/CtaA family protein [Marmoricola sp.]
MRLDPYLRPLGWATLVANGVLVVTGGAVRLTGSGLGCPTWPHCTTEGDFTPRHAVSAHSLIEFGNRTLTFVLAAIAVATFVAAWQSRRRDLRLIALVIGLGIPAQAVIGGITVLTDLNPWIVSLHLVSSLLIIALSVLFLRRVDGPAPAYVGGPLSMLATLNSAVGWVVLYIGTVVTGSGPHAGDAKAPRNGLDPLQVSQAHADVVFLFVGLTVALVVLLPVAGVPGEAARAARVLLGLEVAQGVLGFVQYFTDLPVVLVGLHMLGAALIAAAMTWLLLAVRERPLADAAQPAAQRPAGASLGSE